MRDCGACSETKRLSRNSVADMTTILVAHATRACRVETRLDTLVSRLAPTALRMAATTLRTSDSYLGA